MLETALVSGCWPLAVAASIHDCSWLASCVSAELGSLGKMSEHSISENSSLRILEVLGGVVGRATKIVYKILDGVVCTSV